jgi:hypothetical protein
MGTIGSKTHHINIYEYQTNHVSRRNKHRRKGETKYIHRNYQTRIETEVKFKYKFKTENSKYKLFNNVVFEKGVSSSVDCAIDDKKEYFMLLIDTETHNFVIINETYNIEYLVFSNLNKHQASHMTNDISYIEELGFDKILIEIRNNGGLNKNKVGEKYLTLV